MYRIMNAQVMISRLFVKFGAPDEGLSGAHEMTTAAGLAAAWGLSRIC